MHVFEFFGPFGGPNPVNLVRFLKNPILVDWSVPVQIVCSLGVVVNPSYSDTVLVDNRIDGIPIYNVLA